MDDGDVHLRRSHSCARNRFLRKPARVEKAETGRDVTHIYAFLLLYFIKLVFNSSRQDDRPLSKGAVTTLLKAHTAGDPIVLNELFPLVYDELRRLARRRMRRERSGHSFGTTALLHEVYLKLIDLDRINWQVRAQFFSLAFRVLRNVLVDYAVKRNADQ